MSDQGAKVTEPSATPGPYDRRLSGLAPDADQTGQTQTEESEGGGFRNLSYLNSYCGAVNLCALSVISYECEAVLTGTAGIESTEIRRRHEPRDVAIQEVHAQVP